MATSTVVRIGWRGGAAPERARRRTPPQRAHLGSPDGVLELQRQVGNRATTMAVQRHSQDAVFGPNPFEQEAGPSSAPKEVNAEPPTAEPPSAGNPILGLRKGDGIGSAARRSGVKVLQSRLNEVMDAPPLTVDGQWGSKTQLYFDGLNDGVGTERAEFVGNPIGDALAGGLNGVMELMNRLKGGGGEDQGDGQVDGPQSDLLERAFDQITLEFSKMLKAQNQGLLAMRSDLGTPEKNQAGLLGDLVIKAADLVFDNTLGAGAQSLRSSVKLATSGLPEKLQEVLVDKPFGEAQKGAQGIAKDVVSPAAKGADHNDFFLAQQSGLIGSFHDAMAAFLAAKPQLRRMTPEERDAFTATGVDARLARAAQVLGGLISATGQAAGRTHESSLNAWTRATARAGLLEQGAGDTAVTDLQFLGGVGVVPGVLEIEIGFDPDRPTAPVKAKSVRITGLSPVLRQKLANRTIGSLGFPMRAKGDVSKNIFSAIFDRVNVSVTKDETGVPGIHRDTDDDGGQYLVDKGQDPTGTEGARRIFEELDGVTLASIGGLGN